MKKLISKFTLLFLIMSLFIVGAVAGCNGDGDGDDDGTTFELLLNNTSINAVIGDVNTIVATNLSESAELTWATSNANVATVENGKVEAISEGSATITATYLEYSATCTVNVGFGTKIPQLIVKNAGSTFTIGKSQTAFPFEVSVLFNGKEYTDVSISCSSAGNIVNFDANGNLVPTGVLGSELIYVTGTWRGVSVDRFPSLLTKINVNVVNEMYYYVNGEPINKVNLDTLKLGQKFENEMDFTVQGFLNGVEIDASKIEVSVPSFVKYENGKLKGLFAGEGKIFLSYKLSSSEILQQVIDVRVDRVELEFDTVIDYFSSNTGTYKDHNDGWKDKSVIDTVFNGFTDEDISLSTMRVRQEGNDLTIDGDKLLNLKTNYDGEYETTISFQSNTVTCDVKMVVYGLVIKEAKDLKNLELKVLKNDDPLTYGIDETQVTCIDGYVALLNSIDASDIKMEHTAMYTTYRYRKSANDLKTMTISPNRYMYGTYNRRIVEDHIAGKFGFVGNFDGRGNTIFNLDVSTTPTDTIGGGGLFGWTIGKVNISNVAFRDLNCSNACGIVNEAKSYGGHNGSIDPLGIRIGEPTYTNVYLHLSADTVAPQGAFMRNGAGGMYNAISNVVIDASDVKLNGATKGALFVNVESSACPWNTSNNYYYTSNSVYIISPEVPVFFNANVTVVGRNHADNDSWLRLPLSLLPDEAPDNVRFSPDFYTYNSYSELIADSHDFSTFSSSWALSNYPVFKSSKQVIATYDDVVKLDNNMILSTTDKTRNIGLTSYSEGTVITDISFSDYDTEKVSITVEGDVGKIKLAKPVTSASGEDVNITLNYKVNGKAQSMTLNFLLMPSLIEVDKNGGTESAVEFAESIKDDIIDGQIITSVKQTIEGGQEKEISVVNGKVGPLSVKVNESKDGVFESTILVETADLSYKFTNVAVYTHVIKNGEDLRVFEQTADTEDEIKYGYYILANNVDASGIVLNHATLDRVGGDRYTESKAYFQGILDGQGYAINNFDARMAGLFRTVRSDAEDQAIIRNLAFTNVVYSGNKAHGTNTGFTIFGYQVKAEDNTKVLIQNVHVEIANVERSTGFQPSALYKGLFYHNTKMNNVELENVYINVIEEDAPVAISDSEGTLFSLDDGVRGSSKEVRQTDGRFTNVVTVSELNPSNHATINRTLESFWAGYFAYAENTIGQEGIIHTDRKDAINYRYTQVDVDAMPNVVDGKLQDKVSPALYYYMTKQADDTNPAEYARAFDDEGIRVTGVTDTTVLYYYHNSDHPIISDNPETHSYIYYGVYKYAEEYDVDANKLALFTATGLWELVDKEFTIGEGADAQTITKQVLQWKSVA